MRLEAGASIGRYVVEAPLGQGGMGEVYRARDALLQRSVAIKILRNAGGEAADAAMTRILAEARTVAALQHPNVVSLFDIGEHEGTYFLAMELIEGRSLRAFVGRSDVSLAQRVQWLADLGRGLDAAHRAGIVHRDLKPENIMVNDAGMVKLLDFGIGRRMSTESDTQSPSTGDPRANRWAGTPRYMAPEQARRKEVDGRTDQFAWGVVAYELFTGTIPWSCGTDHFDVLYSIINDTPRPIEDVNPEVPVALASVIMRALAKEPAGRFASMGDALDALEKASPSIATLARSGIPDKPATNASNATLDDNTRSLGITRETKQSSLERISLNTFNPVRPPPSDAPPLDSIDIEARHDVRLPADVEPIRAHKYSAQLRKMAIPIAAVAVLVVAFGILATRSSGEHPSAPVLAQSVASSAPVVPTTMLDLAPSIGCNTEASTLFRAGTAMQHDGNWGDAHVQFERAVQADPNCASAYLRLTQTAYFLDSTVRMREIYQRAVELRGSLTERDRGLLDALEPLVRRDPADRTEAVLRLRALAERFPNDAEIAYLLAENNMNVPQAIASCQAALKLDPRYSDALQLMGRLLARTGHLQEAAKTIDECIRLVPSSGDCIHQRIDIARSLGSCQDAEAFARKWVAMAPKSAEAYGVLARALAANGRPLGAIEEAYRQRWARLSEHEVLQEKPLVQVQLDVFLGHFDQAEAKILQFQRTVQENPSYEVQAAPVLLFANLLLETERLQEASVLAENFLGRRYAWATKLRGGSFEVLTSHLELLLLDVQRDAQRMTESKWKEARGEWIQWARQADRFNEPTLWALDAAMRVRTESEAKEAIQSMPVTDLGGWTNPSWDVLAVPLFTGRALFLAGRTNDAVDVLRRGAAHCDALEIPFEDTYTNFWLGQALEKKGDVAGACEAYGVVMRRWGHATPPSRSARAAHQRAQALGCKL